MGKFWSVNRLLIHLKQRLIKKSIYQTLRNSRTYEDIYTGAHYKVLRVFPFTREPRSISQIIKRALWK